MINLASINLIGEKWNVIIYSLMSRKVGLYWTHLICVSFISQPCLLTRFSVTHSASAVAEAKGPHTPSCCCCLVAKSCPTFVWLHRLWPTRLLCSWDFPGKNTEVDSHSLLQAITLTQGSNSGLLLCRWILSWICDFGTGKWFCSPIIYMLRAWNTSDTILLLWI